MSFVVGKRNGIKELLDGYTRINKADISAGTGILIENVIQGTSAENGDFVYVTGTYNGEKVFTAVPSASLDNFLSITPEDVEEIILNKYKMYVESRVSKSNRLYYIAWIDA